MSYTDILSGISTLTEDQLRDLNRTVVNQLKVLRRRKSVLARDTFSRGDRVGFGDPSARGKRAYKEGEIVEIKRTRAEVKVDYVTWTVPLNMLSAI